MGSAKKSTHSIIATKHGIHDMILELVNTFHLDKFLFSERHTIVFVAACMGIILFNNPSATYIAGKLMWVSHDVITGLLPTISINNTNIMILFIQAI